MEFNKILILKISDKINSIPFTQPDKLVQRANGYWRAKPEYVRNADRAVLAYRGSVLLDLDVGPKIVYDRHAGRITFDMSVHENSEYLGRSISAWKTANPVTVHSVTEFKKILEASKR